MDLTPHRQLARHPAGKVVCAICGKSRLYPGMNVQRVLFDARDGDGVSVKAGAFVCWFHAMHAVADDLRIDWPELLPGTDALEAMRRALPENELEKAATIED